MGKLKVSSIDDIAKQVLEYEKSKEMKIYNYGGFFICIIPILIKLLELTFKSINRIEVIINIIILIIFIILINIIVYFKKYENYKMYVANLKCMVCASLIALYSGFNIDDPNIWNNYFLLVTGLFFFYDGFQEMHSFINESLDKSKLFNKNDHSIKLNILKKCIDLRSISVVIFFVITSIVAYIGIKYVPILHNIEDVLKFGNISVTILLGAATAISIAIPLSVFLNKCLCSMFWILSGNISKTDSELIYSSMKEILCIPFKNKYVLLSNIILASAGVYWFIEMNRLSIYGSYVTVINVFILLICLFGIQVARKVLNCLIKKIFDS